MSFKRKKKPSCTFLPCVQDSAWTPELSERRLLLSLQVEDSPTNKRAGLNRY